MTPWDREVGLFTGSSRTRARFSTTPMPTLPVLGIPTGPIFRESIAQGIQLGNQMQLRGNGNAQSPPPAANQGLKYGESVRCQSNRPESQGPATIFRYASDNGLRPYPNPAISQSWDPNWGSPKSIDCAGLPLGAPMNKKP